MEDKKTDLFTTLSILLGFAFWAGVLTALFPTNSHWTFVVMEVIDAPLGFFSFGGIMSLSSLKEESDNQDTTVSKEPA